MQANKQKERGEYGIVSSIYNGNSNAKKSQKQEYFERNAHRRRAIKSVSLFYLSIGTEGRKVQTQICPHDVIYDLPTLKLWDMLGIVFIRPRKITFDRNVFFSTEKR